MIETNNSRTGLKEPCEGWGTIRIGEVGVLEGSATLPKLRPDDWFNEYSMPAYDNGQKADYVLGKSMQSGRIAFTSPILLVNKLNVRQKRIWYIDKQKENSICSGEFLPYKSELLHLPFLKYVLLSQRIVKDFEEMSTGTSNSQRRITPKAFLDYCIYIPSSKTEQQRIASALTSVDNLLSSLDKLIAKKRDIKQGAMQQLLTGKTRLKGFTAPWACICLGDILTVGNGRDYKHLKDGNIPVYGTGGIMTYVNDYLYDGETLHWKERNDR